MSQQEETANEARSEADRQDIKRATRKVKKRNVSDRQTRQSVQFVTAQKEHNLSLFRTW